MTLPFSIGTAKPAAKPVVERAQLVVFRVGDQQYAADVFAVERVLRYSAPRAIPNVPAWLEGVIDYSGRAVPVIDLRARFDLPAAGDRTSARILVFIAGADDAATTTHIAAAVDGVDEVTTVEKSALEEPPAVFRGLARQYLKALVRQGGTVVVVLDVAQLLNSRERIVLDQAMAETTNG